MSIFATFLAPGSGSRDQIESGSNPDPDPKHCLQGLFIYDYGSKLIQQQQIIFHSYPAFCLLPVSCLLSPISCLPSPVSLPYPVFLLDVSVSYQSPGCLPPVCLPSLVYHLSKSPKLSSCVKMAGNFVLRGFFPVRKLRTHLKFWLGVE